MIINCKQQTIEIAFIYRHLLHLHFVFSLLSFSILLDAITKNTFIIYIYMVYGTHVIQKCIGNVCERVHKFMMAM